MRIGKVFGNTEHRMTSLIFLSTFDVDHPNAAGAKMMAAVVYHALTGKKAPE
jgi:hypothetical protein